MNVHPDAVAHLVREGLSPAILEDPRLERLTLSLADEITRYGAEVMPREIFARTSGAEVAAIACEDVEGALRIVPLLRPRRRIVKDGGSGENARADAATESADASEGADPGQTTETAPRVEDVPPRVVELSDGFGLPGLVLAVLDPTRTIEVVEPDLQRIWLLKRLVNLMRARNLRIHHTTPEDFVARNPEAADVVLVKRRAPREAVELATPLLRPDGTLVSWQREDRSRDLRRRLEDPRGRRIRLGKTVGLESAAARNRVLLWVTCAEGEASAAGDGAGATPGSA